MTQKELNNMTLHQVTIEELDYSTKLQIVRVFRGWLYTILTYEPNNKAVHRGSTTFVPDSIYVEGDITNHH